MFQPFRAILGTFDPTALTPQADGDYNTGIQFNGKDIYVRRISVQNISSWIPDEHDKDFLKYEGMIFRNGTYIPIRVTSISQSGVLIENTIESTDGGYLDLYYTETLPNENRMSKFIYSGVGAFLVVAGYFLIEAGNYAESAKQIVFSIFDK